MTYSLNSDGTISQTTVATINVQAIDNEIAGLDSTIADLTAKRADLQKMSTDAHALIDAAIQATQTAQKL